MAVVSSGAPQWRIYEGGRGTEREEKGEGVCFKQKIITERRAEVVQLQWDSGGS